MRRTASGCRRASLAALLLALTGLAAACGDVSRAEEAVLAYLQDAKEGRAQEALERWDLEVSLTGLEPREGQAPVRLPPDRGQFADRLTSALAAVGENLGWEPPNGAAYYKYEPSSGEVLPIYYRIIDLDDAPEVPEEADLAVVDLRVYGVRQGLGPVEERVAFWLWREETGGPWRIVDAFHGPEQATVVRFVQQLEEAFGQ